MHPSTRHPLTLAGCRLGVRMATVAFPGFTVFALAFGAAASQQGLSFAQTLGLSGAVYAGAAQMVALEIWQQVWSPATILAVMTVTAVVNARLILLGATLQPWFAGQPKALSALDLFLLTDANWLFTTRYYNEGGRDLGVYLGAAVALWLLWIAMTSIGYFGGSLVPEPRRYGLDFVMPIFFATMLVPLWKGPRPALPWLAAGSVALVVHALTPGYSFIVAGALAGVATGMWQDE